MLLNPVVEDDEVDGPEHDLTEEADPCAWMLEGLAGDTTPGKHINAGNITPLSYERDSVSIDKEHEHRTTEVSGDPCTACEDPDDDDSVNFRSTPRLELSISEAELDELLRELPIDDEPSLSDAKNPVGAKSEMQWVLAFLTDPEAAASTDAEAKQFAAATSASDIHRDDNYKGFLKDLNDANLLVSSPKTRQLTSSSKPPTVNAPHFVRDSDDNDVQPAAEDQDDSDSDTDEWISIRHLIKQRSGVNS